MRNLRLMCQAIAEPALGGLVWRSRADTVVLTAGALDTWPNLVNRSQALAYTVGVKGVAAIVSGLPVVSFGAGASPSQYNFSADVWSGLTESEIYWVVSHNEMPTTTGLGALYCPAAGYAHVPYNTGLVYEPYCSTARHDTIFDMTGDTRVGAGVLFSYHVRSANNDFRVWLNGTQKYATGTNTFSATNKPTAIFGTAGAYWYGACAEILVYGRAQTTAEQNQTNAYLQGRYRLNP